MGDQSWSGQPDGGTPGSGTSPHSPGSHQAGGEPAGGRPQNPHAGQPGWGEQPQWGGIPGTDQPGQPGWGEQPQWGGIPGTDQPGQPGWGAVPGVWGRPKPGIIPLRPIAFGEIFDGAFQAIRTNPKTMIGFSALLVAITSLLTTVPQAASMTGLSTIGADAEQYDADDMIALTSGLLSAQALSVLVKALTITVLSGLLITAVSSAVLGNRTSPGELWTRTRSRLPRLVGLSLIQTLVTYAAILLPLVPGIAALVSAGGGDSIWFGVALLVPGVIAAIVIAAVLTTRWAFAAPALLLEDQPVLRSLRRSWVITKGSFWRTLLILVVTNILLAFGASALSIPFAVGGSLVSAFQDEPFASFWLNLLQLGISAIGEILVGAVFYPFEAAVVALVYIDLRMRREGLDLELIRASQEGLPG